MSLLQYIAFFLLFSLLNIPIFGQFESFHKNFSKNCKFCHVNESDISTSYISSWQNFSENENFIPYTSSSIDAEIKIPLGSSKLCLSCHDGTMSMEHLDLPRLSKNQIISKNLMTSHPVSFEYDSYLAFNDGELNDPLSSPSGLGGTIDSDLLINGRLECISCHDIHGMRGEDKLLVISNFKSKLCLTCHNK